MSENFAAKTTDANKKIVDSIMTGADTYENMKEQLRAALSMPSASRADETMRLPSVAVPAASFSTTAEHGSSHTHERVIYPLNNDRYVLTGFSDEELDRKEAAIKAALGVQ
jgi:hypothetical protein